MTISKQILDRSHYIVSLWYKLISERSWEPGKIE